jgi:hypothetical protein
LSECGVDEALECRRSDVLASLLASVQVLDRSSRLGFAWWSINRCIKVADRDWHASAKPEKGPVPPWHFAPGECK